MVEVIQNNEVYINTSKAGSLLTRLYYLVSWKNYRKSENT